ncbi:Histone-lysine N-methyltransferase trithorax [Tetrabaena socialis]|uniref:Histone-lysine N-methyltransferase trithorax n=1 Tax=Tetrabaena socialis TaxID=47790 RepID=A0A2J7ZU98_9CHLO|nr:Histone-lysine N-methyltransferase trithorax [Tetrabaena socialis]|eukprot:PNH03853.1 Histone-lysine N-methyltransferase trithorax [Tetrabaena socialis]
MEPAAEPAAKRQRKEPAWKAVFVDPSKIKETLRAAQEDSTARARLDAAVPPPTSSPVSRVLSVDALDNSRVEVLVEHKGRRYRGVLDRTGLPPGIGVATPVTMDELSAIAAAPPHGENPSNMCALCNTPLEDQPVIGISDQASGSFVKARITANWTARVHLQCALWCPEVKEDAALPGYYHHLGQAVRRGRALRCRDCKERGATVGCFQEGCPAVYHLPCGVTGGCAFNVGGDVGGVVPLAPAVAAQQHAPPWPLAGALTASERS